MDAYFSDKRFRTRDPRFAGRDRYNGKKRTHFALEDYHHDESRDQYICPNGKVLSVKVKRHASEGTVYRRYRAQQQDCKDCAVKAKCLYGNSRGPKTLNVPLGPDGVNLSKLMVEKIESEQGRRIYTRRIAIIEPVFANLRTHKQLDRFTLRSKAKVDIQWMLYCMVHNIEKIARARAA